MARTSRKKVEEFTARKHLPRGVHITVYDLQGTAISKSLADNIVATVEEMVKESGMPDLAVDVRKG